MKKMSMLLACIFVICSFKVDVQAAEIQKNETEIKTLEVISNEDIADYYKRCVMVGDSVAGGLASYASKNESSLVHNMLFLTAGGFGAQNALKEISEESVHPEYNGKQQYIWDSISQMDVEQVIISFGMNDLNPCRNRTASKFEEVIEKILEKNSDVRITIMSITPVLQGAEVGRINNDFIRETNDELETLARENNWGYIDVMSRLVDEEGNLFEPYCSDGFVHLSRSAYEQVYENIFREFVRDKISIPNKVWVDNCTKVVVTKRECELLDIPSFKGNLRLMIPVGQEIQATGFAKTGFYRVNVGDGNVYYVSAGKVTVKE